MLAKNNFNIYTIFAVGNYSIDKERTLINLENPALIESLKEQGFITVE